MRSPFGAVANMLGCNIVVSELELESRYCVQLRTNTHGKGVNRLILSVIGLIEPLLSFYKVYFGIKYLTEVDMLLNKGTKRNKRVLTAKKMILFPEQAVYGRGTKVENACLMRKTKIATCVTSYLWQRGLVNT